MKFFSFLNKENYKPQVSFFFLGNPGKEYESTRHNIGWLIGNRFCIEKNIRLKRKSIYIEGKFQISGLNGLVVFPLTYMNRSGEAVRAVKSRYQLENKSIVVVGDEINFPFGKIHLKKGGSDGGHNGLSSVINEIGEDFYRLRCGIDKNFPPGGLVDYVLSDFDENEFPAVEIMLKNAVISLEIILLEGNQKAVEIINSTKRFLS